MSAESATVQIATGSETSVCATFMDRWMPLSVRRNSSVSGTSAETATRQ